MKRYGFVLALILIASDTTGLLAQSSMTPQTHERSGPGGDSGVLTEGTTMDKHPDPQTNSGSAVSASIDKSAVHVDAVKTPGQ